MGGAWLSTPGRKWTPWLWLVTTVCAHQPDQNPLHLVDQFWSGRVTPLPFTDLEATLTLPGYTRDTPLAATTCRLLLLACVHFWSSFGTFSGDVWKVTWQEKDKMVSRGISRAAWCFCFHNLLQLERQTFRYWDREVEPNFFFFSKTPVLYILLQNCLVPCPLLQCFASANKTAKNAPIL